MNVRCCIFCFCILFLVLGTGDAFGQSPIKKKRGTVKLRHANGKLSARGKVQNYRMQGQWKFYDTGGNLSAKTFYINDTAHGNYTGYFPDGTIMVLGQYCMNKKCSNWKTFDRDGKIIADENFHDDKIQGVQQFWYPDGQMREYIAAANGLISYHKEWYRNGRVKRIESFRDGKPHGTWRTYPDPDLSNDTFPIFIDEYRDGVHHGFHFGYENGRLIEEFQYSRGLLHGLSRRWSTEGQPVSVEWYTENNIDSGMYYNRGRLELVQRFKEREKHGAEVEFNRYGDTLKLTWWKKGNPDSSFTYHSNGRRSSALIYEYNSVVTDNYIISTVAIYTEWDTAGRKLQTGRYIDGLKHGEWLTFYPDGKKRSSVHWSDNKVHEKYTRWHPNGIKMLEGNYESGQLWDLKIWNEQGVALKPGTKAYEEIAEGTRPDEIFSEAAQNNRPILIVRLPVYKEPIIETEYYEEEKIYRDDHIGLPHGEYVNPDDPNNVYNYCEVMPEFPGGSDARIKFIAENLQDPRDVKDQREGIVFVEYIVERDGRVTGVLIKKGIPDSPDLESAAIDVVKKFPKHSPGLINGSPVRSRVVVPIKFILL